MNVWRTAACRDEPACGAPGATVDGRGHGAVIPVTSHVELLVVPTARAIQELQGDQRPTPSCVTC
jgi:hypothetical protein